MCYDAPTLSSAIDAGTVGTIGTGNWQSSMANGAALGGQRLQDQYGPVFQGLVGNEVNAANGTTGFGQSQIQQYQNVFQPVERQFANDAMTFDSAGNTEARAGQAAATVQDQFDTAQGANARRMAASGVSPASGRSQQAGVDQANALAMAKAGAVNQSRTNSNLTGIQLRGQAAGMGRNVAATGLQASGLGSQQRSAAGGLMTGQAGFNNTTMAGAGQFARDGSNSFAAGGQLGVSRGQLQHGMASADADSTGSTIGTIASAAALFLSSEKSKKNIKPLDDDEALDAMRKVPVKRWDYKEGEGDSGSHIGPIAEDLQAAAGDQVAPGGEAIDMVSANGMAMAAIRALDKKLSALTKQIGLEEAEPTKRTAKAESYDSMEPLPL